MEVAARGTNGNNLLLRGRWREVSKVVGHLGSPLQDKSGAWEKSCQESTKRKEEVQVVADERKAPGNVDKNTSAIIIQGLKLMRQIEEKEKRRRKNCWEI